jgi:hypothetical protein
MKLPESLIKSSSLTPTQIESLASYTRVRSHEMTLGEAASMRTTTKVKGGGQLKVGSFYRSVQQGRENVKSSILTVVIALWMGFVKSEDLWKLFEHVGRGLPELEESERERVSALIEALVGKIVM